VLIFYKNEFIVHNSCFRGAWKRQFFCSRTFSIPFTFICSPFFHLIVPFITIFIFILSSSSASSGSFIAAAYAAGLAFLTPLLKLVLL
jgi:hypothetical protein